MPLAIKRVCVNANFKTQRSVLECGSCVSLVAIELRDTSRAKRGRQSVPRVFRQTLGSFCYLCTEATGRFCLLPA